MSEGDRLIGTVVAGRYRVQRRLGEGGMGLVYLAVHEALRKQVALKVLGSGGTPGPEEIARFEREAITAANLKHPNIAEATDFGQLPDGGLFLVMEYAEGATLRSLLAEHGRLPPDRALVIVQQVGAALAAAHVHEVVHRDLKPDNVIVTRPAAPGGALVGDLVKVIDFGVAKLRSTTFGAGATGLTSVGTIFGTPEYMAPEQVMGQPVDARADQYALGVIAFELLAGKAPYKSEDLSQLMMMHVGAPVPSVRAQVPELPVAVDDVIARMLAKLPAQRFDSVTDAIEGLATALLPRRSAPRNQVALLRQVAPKTPAVPASAPQGAVASASETANAGSLGPQRLQVSQPLRSAQAPPAGPRARLVLVTVAAASVLGALVVVLLLVRAGAIGNGSTLSPELAAALEEWESGSFDVAGAKIEGAMKREPTLAEGEAVTKPLAQRVAHEGARRVLRGLLQRTTLGRSRAMAAELADKAVGDEPAARDGALELLRPRQELLSNEQSARVRLRDAADCEALERARQQEVLAATASTQRDLERLGRGECTAMLRVNHLCEACAGPVAGVAAPIAVPSLDPLPEPSLPAPSAEPAPSASPDPIPTPHPSAPAGHAADHGSDPVESPNAAAAAGEERARSVAPAAPPAASAVAPATPGNAKGMGRVKGPGKQPH